MKKRKIKSRQLIYDNIRASYEEGKELLQKNPKDMERLYNAILVCAILLLGLAITSIFTQNTVIKGLLVLNYIIFLALGFRNYRKEKQWEDQRKKKTENIKAICRMCIEDEAKKYDVQPEELVLYMCCKYKGPKWIKVVTVLVSTFFTGLAVQYLPGFDQVEHGLFAFIVLLGANMAISTCASYINQKVSEMNNFDFYMLDPYSETFEKIDKKIEQEK